MEVIDGFYHLIVGAVVSAPFYRVGADFLYAGRGFVDGSGFLLAFGFGQLARIELGPHLVHFLFDCVNVRHGSPLFLFVPVCVSVHTNGFFK
jgi:hypothetical protein